MYIHVLRRGLTHVGDILPLSSEVDCAYSEQAKVDERGVLESHEQRRQDLKRQQPQVSVAVVEEKSTNQVKDKSAIAGINDGAALPTTNSLGDRRSPPYGAQR